MPSKTKGDTDIRSGSPGANSSAFVTSSIEGAGHFISGLDFSFRYLAGYSPPPPPAKPKLGTVLVASLVDAATGTETLHRLAEGITYVRSLSTRC